MSEQGAGRFGDLLRRYRREAGLTQEGLAERAGYSTVYVSMLERGQRTPQPATVHLLCRALEASPRQQAALNAAINNAPAAPSGLVGRSHEMTFLERHLHGEGPPVLAFAGEPGIGKSRLLREAADWGAAKGWQVLAAGCHRRGGEDPYAPLIEAIQRYIRDRSEAELRTALQGCAWLVRLLPELNDSHVEPLPAWSLPAAQERRLMFDAVRRFLINVGGPSGTLLVLDDLQWVGSDALDFLIMLVESAPEAPLRLVVAYRDSEVRLTDPLSVVLGDLAHAGSVAHHTLGPLSSDEADQLLARLIEELEAPPPARDLVLRWSGGVPFFLVSFAQRLRQGSLPEPGIPWNVAQGIRQRVAVVSEPARELLGAAAVAGRSAPRNVLGGAIADRQSDLHEILEELCGARLLVEDGDSAYRFTHDVIREVVEGDLSAARRTALHRRVAEALEGGPGGASPEVLAYHYVRSDAADKAIEYLERAGDSSRARYAHATAEGYFRELVDRLEGLGQRARAAAGREKLGAVLGTGGRYDEALAVLEEALHAHAAADDRESLGRTAAQIGRIHYLRGTAEEGIARLAPLCESLSPESVPRALAAMNAALAPLLLARGRYRDQLQAASTSAALARAVDDDRILAEAEVWRGCALGQLGSRDEGRRVQERAIPLTEAAGDLVSLTHALNDVAFAYEQDGQLARSKGYKERALSLAERIGDPVGVANLAFRCGQNAFLRGDWPAARDYFQRAASVVRHLGASVVSPYPLFGLAMLCLAEGDEETARSLGEECLRLARDVEDLQAERGAQFVLSELDLRAHRCEAALDRLLPLAGDPEGLGLHPIESLLAEACSLAGQDAEAQRWASWSVQQAETQRNRIALVEALRVKSLVEKSAGQAEATVRQAVHLAHEMRYPYGEGRSLHAWAIVLAREGRHGEADRRRAEGMLLFDRLGARGEIERARALQTV